MGEQSSRGAWELRIAAGLIVALLLWQVFESRAQRAELEALRGALAKPVTVTGQAVEPEPEPTTNLEPDAAVAPAVDVTSAQAHPPVVPPPEPELPSPEEQAANPASTEQISPECEALCVDVLGCAVEACENLGTAGGERFRGLCETACAKSPELVARFYEQKECVDQIKIAAKAIPALAKECD